MATPSKNIEIVKRKVLENDIVVSEEFKITTYYHALARGSLIVKQSMILSLIEFEELVTFIANNHLIPKER